MRGWGRDIRLHAQHYSALIRYIGVSCFPVRVRETTSEIWFVLCCNTSSNVVQVFMQTTEYSRLRSKVYSSNNNSIYGVHTHTGYDTRTPVLCVVLPYSCIDRHGFPLNKTAVHCCCLHLFVVLTRAVILKEGLGYIYIPVPVYADNMPPQHTGGSVWIGMIDVSSQDCVASLVVE